MLLGIAYFPPVSYFALIAEGMVISDEKTVPSTVYIEAKETYHKQSWRNRCRIYAADGPAYLNFPIVHEGGTHQIPITEIKVDYSTPWVLKTKRAIASAYESSAYFDHYKDELFAILDSHPETLFELDLTILKFFLAKTGIAADLRFTQEYYPPVGGGNTSASLRFAPYPGKGSSEVFPAAEEKFGADYREVLHPKRTNTVLRDLGLEKPYFQVFAQKHGFISDLSIMDLLFNEGPDSILYLKTSIPRSR